MNVPLGIALNGSDACILQVDWNGASTEVYQNGMQQAGGPFNPGTNGISAVYAVGAIASSGVDPYDGWIAEVLIFKPALTHVWRTMVTRYLGARYGIAVP